MKLKAGLAALLLPALALRAAAPQPEPPPGWTRAEPAGPQFLLSFKGPEKSSFVVKRAPELPLGDSPALKGYLEQALSGIRDSSRRDYRGGRVEKRRLRGGLELSVLKAKLGAEERLLLGAFESGGERWLGVLAGAAPESMLEPLFGAVAGAAGAADAGVRVAGVERSLDGQLELALGGGLRARSLSESERARGFVLAVQGAGSELLFQRLAEDDSRPDDQAAIARAVTAESAGVPQERVSPALAAPSAAGPTGVYAWAQVSGGGLHAAGFLPWSFWGYQLLAHGPEADELLTGVLVALRPGPGSAAKMLAATPRVPIPMAAAVSEWAPLACAVGLLLLALVVWRLSRKNARLAA